MATKSADKNTENVTNGTAPVESVPFELTEEIWNAALESADPVTKELMQEAEDIETRYREAQTQRSANRDMLRYRVAMGKLDAQIVDALYPPKTQTRPRRRKDESEEAYTQRTGWSQVDGEWVHADSE